MAPRKDNVDLICSIGELAGLFEKSHSLEDFLQTVVNIVAYHMHAAVCSVYLYDEDKDELTLTATQGLDLNHPVSLKLGEGLTGLALKELRPIREGIGSKNPNYKFIPGIHEEDYAAFLAVPILRGLSRVGVLVLQDPVEDYFEENDAKALQAIAARLATTIENAKLLMALYHLEEQRPVLETADLRDIKFLKGIAAAPGQAVGRPVVFGEAEDAFVIDEPIASAQCTLDDFRRSLRQTEEQLEQLQVSMDEELSDVASMIFSAHLLIVKDRKFSGSMIEHIEAGATPQEAIFRVINQYIQMFSSSPNPRLKEKVQDLKDLGRRLLQNLVSQAEVLPDYSEQIVISGGLLPSDILKLAAQKAEGIVQVGGGATAHISILARSLNLPMVIVDDPRLFKLTEDTTLLVDGDQGNLYVNPEASVLESFRDHTDLLRDAERAAAGLEEETWTANGERAHVLANINMVSELKTARKLKAEGIGLYRSEFPFIVRNNLPSEEEQFRVYRMLIEEMEGREIQFRTLDVGGDKELSYISGRGENNPFLGLRAIRFSFRYKDIFTQQLRALLRAGHDTNLKIMFPMISSVDDFGQACDVVRECIAQLKGEGVEHHARPKLGAMIELPAAVEVIDELAGLADFLSIGGNDLVQYMLAVDRTNQDVSDLYVSHHPAVLRALKRIAVAALRHGKPLSFCGEMASDTKMLPFLLGIGIRRFSVDARRIPAVHKAIGDLDTRVCSEFSDLLLKVGRIDEIETLLSEA